MTPRSHALRVRASRVLRSTSVITLLLLSAIVVPSRVGAQAVMTIIGATGARFGYYDEDNDLSIRWIDFTIKNTGNQGAYARYYGDCGPFVWDATGGSCPSAGHSTGWLAPGQTATLSVGFVLDAYAPSNGIISVTVSASADGVTPGPTPWDVGRVSYSIDTGLATFLLPPITDYQPVVSPKAATETVPFASSLSRSFTVQNTSSHSATYALAASCGAMTGCAPSKTSTTLAPGAADVIAVTFTTPSTLGASNTVTLSAIYTDASSQTIADAGSRPTLTLNRRPSVSPTNGTTIAMEHGVASATFTVSNTESPTTTTLIPICDGWATNCAVADAWYPNPNEPGDFYYVRVSFQGPTSAGTASTPTASVRLAAQLLVGGQVMAADTGRVPAALGYGKPVLTPKTTIRSDAANVVQDVSYTITNTGNVVSSYTPTITCVGISVCYSSSDVIWLQPGASTGISVSYTTPPVGQTGVVHLSATHGVSSTEMESDTARITATGADLLAPVVTIAQILAEGVTMNTAAFQIGITACDPDGQLAPLTVALNGVALSTTVTSSSYSGCTSAKEGKYAMVAQPGLNTLVASVSDGYRTTTTVRHFTYDEAAQATPVVTARVATELLRGGQQWADTFFVTNPGPVPIPYTLTPLCASGSDPCAVSQSTVAIGPRQTATVWIDFTAPTSGPSAWISLAVTYTATSGSHVVGEYVATLLSLDQAAPTAAITGVVPNSTIDVFPTIGVQWCDADGTLATHVVAVDGVMLADTFAGRTQSGCATAGVSSWTWIPVTLGAHTITTTVTDVAGHVTASTVPFTFALPPVADYQPRVTPGVETTFFVPDNQTLTFAVRNAGTRTALYHLAPDCSAIAIVGTCQVDKATLALVPGATDSAHVSFSILGLPSAAGTTGLIATYQDLVGRTSVDTGRVVGQVPTVAQLYQPLVSDAGSYSVSPADTAQVIVAYAFPVRNTGIAPVTYDADITITNNAYGFAPWARPDSTITVNPGETKYAMVQPLVLPGLRAWADIAYTARYTAPTGATVSSTGHGYVVPMVVTYGVEVTPKNQSLTGVPASIDFFVRSTGNTPFGVYGTISCTGFVAACRTPSGQTVGLSLSPTPSVVTVGIDVDSTRGHTGTITLSVRGEGNRSASADSATYTVTASSIFVGVTVSPDSIQIPVSTDVDIVQHFDITSIGTLPAQFDYTVTCTGAASCQSFSDRTAMLPHLAKQTVPVTYHTATTLGARGSVRLIAWSALAADARDTGVVAISVEQLSPIAVHTVDVNPGPNVTRGQCIAVAAGDDAAYECGDLRIAHALPATTTMNKSRAPVLVYNSAHAAARGIVSANVVVAQGFSPGSLHATLQFTKSGTVVERDIPWLAEYGDAHPRRVAVQFDAHALGLTTPDHPVGAFSYTLVIRANDVPSESGRDTGTVVVIDRTSSIFGKGWWLDGLEQLSFVTPDSDQVLWVGGDGTTRMYTRLGSSWRVTPALDRVDSLTLAGSTYTRYLPNGAHVEFNTAGRHTATVNTQGHRTKFQWSTALDKLNSIQLPVPSTASAQRSYQFAYYAATSTLPWRLEVVTAPGAAAVRQVVLTYATASGGSNVVTRIADPDLSAVNFGYDGLGRLVSRTDRLRSTTTYGYDEANGLQRSVVTTTPADIVRTFCAAETAGLTTCAPPGLDTRQLMAWFDGPRNDVPDTTWFRTTSFGAPSLIIDATHDTTRIERGDPHWPLLVTKVVDVRGYAVSATYDPDRALVMAITDLNGGGTLPATLVPTTTRYFWDTKWDRVTRSVSPMGVVTRSTYDATTGERIAQYAGEENTRFVQFGYDPSTQLVATVTTPLSTAPMRYDYDALGNLQRTTTPIGFVSTIDRDFLGRDSVARSPMDSLQTLFRVQKVSYDIMDRVVASTDTVPAVVAQGSVAQALHIANAYDAEGRLTAVSRWSVPDPAHTDTLTTDYIYDQAGRKLTERDRYAPPTQTATWHYDPASNVRQLDTRGLQSITMQYDTLNRLTQRDVPAVVSTYGAVADVAMYTYDAAGNMLTATNSWSRVIRTYDRSGRVIGDTMLIKPADLAAPGMRHSYGLINTYDLDGRRIAQQQPANLAPSGNGQVGYTYDPATGQLQSVTDPQGNSFGYFYNTAGLPATLVMPAGASEVHEYDADGREKHRSEVSLGVTLHDDRFGRDARGNILNLAGQSSVASPSEAGSFVYGGLGAVLSSQLSVNDLESLHFNVDAFGNTLRKQQDGNELSPGLKLYTHTYEPHSNRLATVTGQIPTGTDLLTHYYDASGNLSQEIDKQVTAPVAGERAPHIEASWTTILTHDALGRLMFAERATVNDNTHWQNQPSVVRTVAAVALGYGSYEEYRYDALGRRIWKRTHRTPYCTAEARLELPAECTSAIGVTVWDGGQVLYELRAAGGDDLTGSALEQGIDVPTSSVGPAGQFGTIMYVHGVGIDRPLELIRSGQTMVLHASWRGMVDLSTNAAGQITTCGYTGAVLGCTEVKWPGQESGLQFNRPRPVEVSRPWYGDMVQGNADASGLQYKRNRYYDPGTGRFTQEDPIGLAGGMNLYGFAGGDPVNFSDPFGLCFWDGCVAEAYATGIAAAGLAALVTAAYVDMTSKFGSPATWFSKSPTSGETEAAAGGRAAHRTWDPGAGFQKEVRLPSGKRCDALNSETCVIKELKPENDRAKKRGEKQLKGYKDELDRETGKEHKTKVETYKPKQ